MGTPSVSSVVQMVHNYLEIRLERTRDEREDQINPDINALKLFEE